MSIEPTSDETQHAGGNSSADATELRVHGVSGTSEAEQLLTPWLVQVAGDKRAGFYAPGHELAHLGESNGTVAKSIRIKHEAYNWGNLTSGAAAKAFWLLLLPFTLSNVMVRFVPTKPEAAASGKRALYMAAWWVSRIFSLSITALFALVATGITVDVIAWQSGTIQAEGSASAGPNSADLYATNQSVIHPVNLGWLVNWWIDWSLGPRIAIASVFPLVVVFGLWLISRNTWRRYEQVDNQPAKDFYTRKQSSEVKNPLAHPDLWRSYHLVARLRSMHIFAALAVVAVTVSWPLLLNGLYGSMRWQSWLATAVIVLGVIGCAVVIASLGRSDSTDRRSSPRRDSFYGTVRYVLGVLLWAAAAFAAFKNQDDFAGLAHKYGDSWIGLPGYSAGLTIVFALQVILLLIFTLCVVALRPDSSQPRPGLKGLAGPAVGILALVIAGALSTGAYLLVGTWSRGMSGWGVWFSSGDVLDTLILPDLWHVVSVSIPPTSVVCAVLLTVAFVVTYLRCGRYANRAVREDYGTQVDAQQDFYVKRVKAAYRWGKFIDEAGLLLAALIGPIALSVVGAWIYVVYALLQSRTNDRVFDSNLDTLSLWGLGMTQAFVLGLVSLGFAAFRMRSTRKLVGILWDLCSFWPRIVHPLAAPCYAERAVPELVNRVEYLVSSGDKTVLSGHSQGSVLSVAVASQLPQSVWPKTSLVTYGCVVQRLYSRFFPTYFGIDVLKEVPQNVGNRWVNLWRQTDYLGGSVKAPKVEDVQWLDPVQVHPLAGDICPPTINRHSRFQAQSDFDPVIQDVVDRT